MMRTYKLTVLKDCERTFNALLDGGKLTDSEWEVVAVELIKCQREIAQTERRLGIGLKDAEIERTVTCKERRERTKKPKWDCALGWFYYVSPRKAVRRAGESRQTSSVRVSTCKTKSRPETEVNNMNPKPTTDYQEELVTGLAILAIMLIMAGIVFALTT